MTKPLPHLSHSHSSEVRVLGVTDFKNFKVLRNDYKVGAEVKMWNASRFCVSSLRRGHANLLCIVPILVYVLPKQVQRMAGKLKI